MIATPTNARTADERDRAMLETRELLRAEHHHMTLEQLETVATETLLHVDPELVCDALVADESTVPIFIGCARRAVDERERLAWLTLSTLRAAALKTPTMLALGAAQDRAAALRHAVDASGGAVTVETLREVLTLGPGRWVRCNEAIAAARDSAARRSWQVVRLAGHNELHDVAYERSSGRRRRRRPRRRRSA